MIGLQVCCGDRKIPEIHAFMLLPSISAEDNSINAAPPSDAARFVLRLLGVLFTTDQLALSNCTKAEGRELLDPHILNAVRCKGRKLYCFIHLYCPFFYTGQTNTKFPESREVEESR